jgi:hypothetical protein
MCEPTTLMMVAMGVGAATSAYSASAQASAQKQSLRYQSQVAQNNAKVAEWQAQDAVTRGNAALEQHQRKVASLKGSQTASMAARGLSLDEGTPINILSDTDYFGKIDGNTITANAAREAWGYKVQGNNQMANSTLMDWQNSGISPGRSAGLSLLGSATSAATMYYGSKAGAGGGSKVSQGEMMNLMADFNDK